MKNTFHNFSIPSLYFFEIKLAYFLPIFVLTTDQCGRDWRSMCAKDSPRPHQAHPVHQVSSAPFTSPTLAPSRSHGRTSIFSYWNLGPVYRCRLSEDIVKNLCIENLFTSEVLSIYVCKKLFASADRTMYVQLLLKYIWFTVYLIQMVNVTLIYFLYDVHMNWWITPLNVISVNRKEYFSGHKWYDKIFLFVSNAHLKGYALFHYGFVFTIWSDIFLKLRISEVPP